MKILISGSTGFIGSNLVKFLESKGHEIFHLVLDNADSQNKILWNIDNNFIDTKRLDNIDVLINLAGENIATGRWTKSKKERIYNSRVNGTKLLADALIKSNKQPKLWINASAIGYYGDTADKLNKEDSPNGTDFLAKVCQDWENAALTMASEQTRVVILRFGVVLNKAGGMISQILSIFNAGIGGVLGNGKQYFPWVALEDLLNIINFAIDTDISGVYNATSPNIITNGQFTQALATALKKHVFIPVPSFALKILYGEMAQTVLLSSTKASPDKLIEAGYKFKHTDIKKFLFEEFN